MLADAELALGYDIAIHPVYLLGAAVTAMREALRALRPLARKRAAPRRWMN